MEVYLHSLIRLHGVMCLVKAQGQLYPHLIIMHLSVINLFDLFCLFTPHLGVHNLRSTGRMQSTEPLHLYSPLNVRVNYNWGHS